MYRPFGDDLTPAQNEKVLQAFFQLLDVPVGEKPTLLDEAGQGEVTQEFLEDLRPYTKGHFSTNYDNNAAEFVAWHGEIEGHLFMVGGISVPVCSAPDCLMVNPADVAWWVAMWPALGNPTPLETPEE